jgi:membrane protein
MIRFNDIKFLTKQTFKEFAGERPFLHGAALSYYALMTLVPMLYLSITFFGSFMGYDQMLVIIADLLHDQIGVEDISGIMEFLDEVDLDAGSTTLKVVGIGALMFSCTAILNSLKKSMDDFYDIDRRSLGRKKRIVRNVISRILFMLTIAALTALVIALYFAETVFLSLGNRFFKNLELA